MILLTGTNSNSYGDPTVVAVPFPLRTTTVYPFFSSIRPVLSVQTISLNASFLLLTHLMRGRDSRIDFTRK
jgi:hypothetical protein